MSYQPPGAAQPPDGPPELPGWAPPPTPPSQTSQYPPPPSPPSYPPAPPPPPPPQYASPQYPPSPPPPYSSAQPPIGQMGQGGVSAASLWQPFAGKGQKGRHVAWLLDGLGHRADDLRREIEGRFSQRSIPNANQRREVLTARGVAAEQRPYYIFQRGVATVALYIAQLGRDLYISQATFALGAISTVRIIIASVIALVALVGCCILPTITFFSLKELDVGDILGGYGGSSVGNMLATSACCFGPIGLIAAILLGVGLVFSLYKGLSDRDPLAILRAPLNDFQQDDLIALEKAVEQTVCQSMDAIGIDSKLLPPAPEYGMRRRVI